MSHLKSSVCTPTKKAEHEACNDLAHTPLQKVYLTTKTALLQVYTNLFGLCHRGISETWLFCRLYPYVLATVTLQPLLSRRLRPGA